MKKRIVARCRNCRTEIYFKADGPVKNDCRECGAMVYAKPSTFTGRVMRLVLIALAGTAGISTAAFAGPELMRLLKF